MLAKLWRMIGAVDLHGMCQLQCSMSQPHILWQDGTAFLLREARELEERAADMLRRAAAFREAAETLTVAQRIVAAPPLASAITQAMSKIHSAMMVSRSSVTATTAASAPPRQIRPLDNTARLRRVPTSSIVLAELKAFPGQTISELADHIMNRIQSKATRRKKLVRSTVEYLMKRERVRRDLDGKLYVIGAEDDA